MKIFNNNGFFFALLLFRDFSNYSTSNWKHGALCHFCSFSGDSSGRMDFGVL